MAKSKHVRSTFECHWDAHPGGCVRTNHGYCPSPISERDTHHSGNMLMGVCLKLSSPDSTKPSSIVLYQWKFSSLQNLRTNPKPLSSCCPGAQLWRGFLATTKLLKEGLPSILVSKLFIPTKLDGSASRC